MQTIYIQLYSLKDETAKDFTGTLEKVANIGYTGVEFAAGFYGGLSASELKQKCESLGLVPLGSHVVSAQVPAQLDYLVQLGVKYIIDPYAQMATTQDTLAFADVLNKTGKLCHDAGIIFGYHNHQHEFQTGDDGYLLETLLQNTDPKYVCFQLDVGWATAAGVDAPAFIAKYPGRFKQIHVKESNNEPSGKGIIDWHKVRDAALAQEAEDFILEREGVYAGDIFSCIQEDYAFLKSL